MIQAIQNSNLTTYINTEANRINLLAKVYYSPNLLEIQFLCKFTNDMDGEIFYSYPRNPLIYPRFTEMQFLYSPAPNDMFSGQLALLPAGYYHYEVYEVTWGTPTGITSVNAPATETDVLPVLPQNGVVQGIVAIGKLFLSEQAGFEQVQYVENQPAPQTNYIYYGQ